MLLAIGRRDFHVAQRFEHSERECGGALAAPGKRDDDEELVGVGFDAGREHRRRQRDDLLQRLLAGRRAAAGGEGDECASR